MKHLSPTLALVAGIGIRAVVFGASIGDALAITSLCALHAYTSYLASIKHLPINDEVKADIVEIKSAIGALKMAKSLGR